MAEIKELYEPFQKELRKYELIDSLQLIWGISRNLIFDYKVPDDIELLSTFHYDSDVQTRRFNSLHEFEMEFLMKEMIINCSVVRKEKSLKKIKNLGKIVDYVRHVLDNAIITEYVSDNILIEFNRIVHRQFIWQMGYHTSVILRYYKLYTHKDVVRIFEETFEMSPFELSIIGFTFFHGSGAHFGAPIYRSSNIPGISIEMFDKFLSMFSSPLEEIKNELKAQQQINANLFYSYNPLLAKPLITYENHVICPMPWLVLWKITSGLYYSLVGKTDFDKGFGNAFQDYIGEVIKVANISDVITVLPEELYGKQEKRTSDWIIYDKEAVLFIECKTKRLTLPSKTSLNIDIEKGMQADLDSMASAILQLYKTFIEFKNGKYPSLQYDDKKNFYPVVVTLEEWFLPINPMLVQILHEKVSEKIKLEGIDMQILDQHPYYVSSADHFENHIQIIQEQGITRFFELLNSSNLNIDYKHLFAGEFETIFLKPVGLA